MPSLNEKRGTQSQQALRAGTISFDGSGIDCVVRKVSGYGANLEVESQIGIVDAGYLPPRHSGDAGGCRRPY